MKITEFQKRITILMKIVEVHCENQENHKNMQFPYENHKNHENHRILKIIKILAVHARITTMIEI